MDKIELTKWLNSLIGSEMIAFLQYEFAAHTVIGTDYDSCTSEFKQHADEERDHMNKLIDCAIERDLEVNQDLISIIQMSNPVYEVMLQTNSSELLRFHFKAEEGAIKTYREFYNIIKDDDITLAKEIKSILNDEIEHRKDLKKIASSTETDLTDLADMNISQNFSKLTARLKKINFNSDDKMDSDELFQDFENKKFKWSYITVTGDEFDKADFNGKDFLVIFKGKNILFEINPEKTELFNNFKLGGDYWGKNTKEILG